MCNNIQNCCRICLDMESDHVSILGDPTISLHMKSCLAVTISPNDNLPKEICMSCVSQLYHFFNFQLNASCSQDWLESSVQEKLKKSTEAKAPLQPLPDSEYNSDSLLEFLNNNANIEEYLNNLGKEDIPSIVNMLDKNEQSIEVGKVINFKPVKQHSPQKKEMKPINCKLKIDVLDSDIEIVKEIILKENEPKNKSHQINTDKNFLFCFACKTKFESIQKLLQHQSTCDNASRTCKQCNILFDSKQKMQQHSITHNTSLPMSCNCGKQFMSKDLLITHHKFCHNDYGAAIGYAYRCKVCGDTFKERFQLYRHIRGHIVKKEERICDICGHTFIGSDLLMNHKKEEHGKVDGSLYKCKVCNLTSPDHKEMYLHVQKHTAKPESNCHLCESCGRSFATRTSLLRHSSQHSNKNYKCNICGKSFTSKSNLEGHVLEHDEIAMCERCGQTVSRYRFEVHICV